MSIKNDWIEQNDSLLEGKSEKEIDAMFEEACDKGEAAYEAQRDLEEPTKTV